MSVNGSSGKPKLRPGRKSMRSESGSENMLRRSSSNREDSLDYEVSPSAAAVATPPAGSSLAHGTSTESVRHFGLNYGELAADDIDTTTAAPPSARSHPKYASTRELPKNWSDDESVDATEQESIKSADESVPVIHGRHHSKSNSQVMESANSSSSRRSSVQEVSPLSAPSPTQNKAERKRSSANARVSPRHDKKPSSTYTTLVTREKLDRTSLELLNWAQAALSCYKSVILDSWDHFKDGIALIHLIHYCDSTSLNLDEFDTSDPLRTLEAAFSIAESKLGIPNVFDAKSLMESRLGSHGPDLRTFILYLSHFRTAYNERHMKDNPLNSARSVLANLTALVNRKVAQVSNMGESFQHECDRLTAMTTKDEIHAERSYLQQRSITMDKMMEMSRQLTSELEAQNLSLREQNRLLTEKISHLNRAVEQEKQEKDAALARMEMNERIQAMAALLEEPDLEKYIESHKEEIDRLTVELTEAQSAIPRPSARGEASAH